jgi:pimeloyl-ACP methyl ester carboxylesterase
MLKSFGSPPLFYEASGSEPPEVVALHGWARDRSDFAAALKGLPAISVDLPGFGMTPPPPQPWGSIEYAEHVGRLVESLQRPVVLVGHSFGARVAVRLAARMPAAVRSLVLTGAPLAKTGQPARKAALGYRLARAAHRRGLLSDEAMERGRRRYGSRDYAAAQGVMRAILVGVIAESYDEDLARLEQPVTLVWGAGDADVPLAVANLTAQRLRDATVVVQDGVGHDLPWRSPEVLRTAIVERLQQ